MRSILSDKNEKVENLYFNLFKMSANKWKERLFRVVISDLKFEEVDFLAALWLRTMETNL